MDTVCREGFAVGYYRPTKDEDIRGLLREALISELMKSKQSTGHPTRIISELGVNHGASRIDIATVNGLIHGYEIKSDMDTLLRLPEQSVEYSKVFDKITLVVGREHVIDSIDMIPIWWGVVLAKISEAGSVTFSVLREASANPCQEKLAIARLLWKDEAIEALGQIRKHGICGSKDRESIYAELASSLSLEKLLGIVKMKLLYREDWRVDQPLL